MASTTFFNCGNYRSKIIIRQNYIRGFPGHVGTFNAHGYPDISRPQSRGVIDSISGHSDNVAAVFKSLDDFQFLQRLNSRP